MGRALDVLQRIEDVVAKACLAGCSALVFVAAVTRAFGAPIVWAIDIAMMLFIWCSFLGANQALRNRQHIIIDILVRRFPRPWQRALLIFHWTVIAVFLVALIVLGTQLTLLNWQRPMGDTDISYAYVTSAVPIGSLLLLITTLAQLRTFWRTRDLGFGAEAESPL